MPAVIDVKRFVGMTPGVSVRKLPVEVAAEAANIRTHSDDLEAWQGLLGIEATLTAGIVRGIYLYDNTHWFSSNTVASVIRSPVAQDPYERVYYTLEDTYPQVTSNLIATGGNPKPVASYRLGVPQPDTAITGTINVDPTADPEDFSDDETRYYVMTYVTEYGEEGPPGPVSTAFELGSPSIETVSLTLPVLASNPYNVTHKRIYRTVTSGNGTDYYLVGEVPLAFTSFEDTIAGASEYTELPAAIGKVLDTVDYDLPPEDMRGLVMGANGIAAGFDGNQIVFSVAFKPYAYPVGYRQVTDYDIVAIVPTATGFVVGTKGTPYVFAGVSPDSMSSMKLDVMHACISSRSMVDMGEYALYASKNGLVAAGEGIAKIITEGVVTQREWADYAPATIHAYRYQDMYFAFYGDTDNNGTGTGGFVFDPRSKTFFELDFYATAGYNDVENDALYLVVDGALVQWDADSASPIAFTWRSGMFKTRPIALSCAKVFTDAPADVSFKLWADGVLVLDLAALTTEAFRLPDVRATEWQFEVGGTGVVQRVCLATAMSELD